MSNHTIPSEISRSWLLVNGAKSEGFEFAAATGADEIILDIEDAVDPAIKAQARADVIAWLKAGNEAWVRINDRLTPYWNDDVAELARCENLKGVILAKVEDAAHVSDTSAALGEDVRVIALIESALGIEEARAIACSAGVFRLAFGSGDYRKDTGTAADDLAMAYPRSRLVVASRIGNLPGPIDGPTISPSHSIIREKTEVAVALGMTGKLVIDQDKVSVINEAISPTQSDIEWAQNFLADFESRGRVVRDGSDLPRLGRAEKIVKLASSLGLV